MKRNDAPIQYSSFNSFGRYCGNVYFLFLVFISLLGSPSHAEEEEDNRPDEAVALAVDASFGCRAGNGYTDKKLGKKCRIQLKKAVDYAWDIAHRENAKHLWPRAYPVIISQIKDGCDSRTTDPKSDDNIGCKSIAIDIVNNISMAASLNIPVQDIERDSPTPDASQRIKDSRNARSKGGDFTLSKSDASTTDRGAPPPTRVQRPQPQSPSQSQKSISGGESQPSQQNQKKACARLCFGEQEYDLYHGVCKSRRAYICNSCSAGATVNYYYRIHQGRSRIEQNKKVSVPANADIGAGAPEIGFTHYLADGLCYGHDYGPFFPQP